MINNHIQAQIDTHKIIKNKKTKKNRTVTLIVLNVTPLTIKNHGSL